MTDPSDAASRTQRAFSELPAALQDELRPDGSRIGREVASPVVTPVTDSMLPSGEPYAVVLVEPALRWVNPLTETGRRGALGLPLTLAAAP